MKFGRIIFACLIIILTLGAVSASQTDNNLTAIGDAMVVEDSNLAVAGDEIALGDTHNYIYNCLVNNNIGIRIPANRIFNDL